MPPIAGLPYLLKYYMCVLFVKALSFFHFETTNQKAAMLTLELDYIDFLSQIFITMKERVTSETLKKLSSNVQTEQDRL